MGGIDKFSICRHFHVPLPRHYFIAMPFLWVFLRLIRYPNLLMIALTQWVARYFVVGDSAGPILTDLSMWLIMASTLCIAAAGYIINDYFDVKIDRVNKPNEVIIGRYMKRRWAIVFHQTLSLLGMLFGFFVHWKVFLINTIAVGLLWLYAERFKRQAVVGNVVVSGLTGAALVVLAVFYDHHDKILNIYAVFAFFISLIREIIKDMEDVKGDQKFGCQTLPILLGIHKTKQIVWVLMVSFAGIVLSMGWALQNPMLMWIYFLLGIPVLYVAIQLIRADRPAHFAHLSWLCKIIMLCGITSLAVV
ncbi:MAG: geranylgeranylglycerol-phosphate geranylgeranyltransferase [Spirosomataceae bacterium]